MKKIKFILAAMIATLGLALSVPQVFAYNFVTTLEYQSEPGADWIEVQTTKVQIYQEDPGEGYLTVDFDYSYTIIEDINNNANFSIRFVSDLKPDNTRPAISGEENFVTNVDDAKPLSFFQQYITAVDETDGVVPVYVITDNYTANMSVLGTHKVVFGAKDNSDNEATLEVYIRVVDITKPVISGNSSVANIGYKETWNISNFKTTLSVSDNYDTLTHNDITVKTDGYTSNKTKLGTYNVVYAVVDNSGNEGTFTKQVKVIDNVKPNISGPTTIATSNNTILTESDVRSQLTASDEIDGNITNKIELVEDNYTGQGNKVGTYTIKYRVVDNAGNIGEHTVTIQRSDKIPPVFFIEDGVTIKTTPTTPLTFEQIIQILDATNQVTINATTTFRTLFNDYTNNEQEPGLYTWSVEAKSTNGSESVHHMSIQVLDVEDEDTIDVTPDFDLVDWAKGNPALATILVIAALGLVVLVIRKFRK